MLNVRMAVLWSGDLLPPSNMSFRQILLLVVAQVRKRILARTALVEKTCCANLNCCVSLQEDCQSVSICIEGILPDSCKGGRSCVEGMRAPFIFIYFLLICAHL